jgi:hypothetical protein
VFIYTDTEPDNEANNPYLIHLNYSCHNLSHLFVRSSSSAESSPDAESRCVHKFPSILSERAFGRARVQDRREMAEKLAEFLRINVFISTTLDA